MDGGVNGLRVGQEDSRLLLRSEVQGRVDMYSCNYKTGPMKDGKII